MCMYVYISEDPPLLLIPWAVLLLYLARKRQVLSSCTIKVLQGVEIRLYTFRLNISAQLISFSVMEITNRNCKALVDPPYRLRGSLIIGKTINILTLSLGYS